MPPTNNDLNNNDHGSWTCEACTFHNYWELKNCEMCESPRPTVILEDEEAATAAAVAVESEEERKAYKTARKAAKKERRRQERREKQEDDRRGGEESIIHTPSAASSWDTAPTGEVHVAGQTTNAVVNTSSFCDQASSLYNEENVVCNNVNGVKTTTATAAEEEEEDLEERKRRFQDKMADKARAAEKKREQQRRRKERFADELATNTKERQEFWKAEIDLESQAVECLVLLCAAEFCRFHPKVRQRDHVSGQSVLLRESQLTFRELYQSSIHSRIAVKGMKQQDLNDRNGTIQYWDAPKGKFYVGLDSAKKGKDLNYMMFFPGNLEALPIESARKSKKKASDPVHLVFIPNLYDNKQLMFEVKKSMVDEMMASSNQEYSLWGKGQYLDKLMERTKDDRLAHKAEELFRQQEEADRKRRAEQRRRENEAWAEQKVEYAQRKSEYQEWKREQHKTRRKEEREQRRS